MNPFQIIATLRKFANYLAGLSPWLATLLDKFSKRLALSFAGAQFELIKKYLAKNAFLFALWKFIERFYWRDYAKDRMEFASLSPEGVPLVRKNIQICVLLSMAILLAQIKIDPVNIEVFSGYEYSVPAWGIWLWLISLPSAWTSLLIGAAACNCVAFAAAAISALYFLSTCVIQLPRSYFNGFLSLAVFLCLVYSQRSLVQESGKFCRLFSIFMVSWAIGSQFTILSPLRPWLGSFIALPGPFISFGNGAVLGVLLTAICMKLSGLDRVRGTASGVSGFDNQSRRMEVSNPNLSMSQMAWIVWSLILLFLLGGLFRGGLSQTGGLILSSLDLSNAYLWPLFYFVGVGIIHKLLGSTKVLSNLASGFMPGRFAVAGSLILLFVFGLASFSDRICLFLSRRGSENDAVSTWLFQAFMPFYSLCKALIWQAPLMSIAAHWMSWVFCFDAMLVFAIVLEQKALRREQVERILFNTCLAALLFWEYLFQLSSFSRGAIHSVVLIWLFAVWLLWLMHTVGWTMSLKDSQRWPSRGRMAIYGSLVSLLVLQVNGRALCGDYRIVNEIFLTMFRGVIDIGLPYYLLLWANKKIKNARVPLARLLTGFAIGGICSLAMNALDKLAASSWSLTAFENLVFQQLEIFRNTGVLSTDLQVPGYWYLIKACLYVLVLLLITSPDLFFLLLTPWAEKKAQAPVPSSLQSLYLALSVASGVVSFSYALVELPFPNELMIIFAPLQQELTFSCALFAKYLALWIPALLIACVHIHQEGVEKENSPAKKITLLSAVSLLSIILNAAILFGIRENEALWRASGYIYPSLVALAGCSIILILQIMSRLTAASQLSSDANNSSTPELESKNVLLSTRSWQILALMAALAYFAISLVFHTPRSFQVRNSLVLASNWKLLSKEAASKEAETELSYQRQTGEGSSYLHISQAPADPKGLRNQIISLLKEGEKNGVYGRVKIMGLDPWGRFSKNALACTFTQETKDADSSLIMSSMLVLVPISDKELTLVCLSTSPAEFEETKWEIAWLVQNLKLKD